MNKIDLNEIKFKKYINEGSFGVIYKYCINNKNYACKLFNDEDYLKGKIKKLDKISNNIFHPNLIIPKYWVTQNNKKIGYLIDFVNAPNFSKIPKKVNLNEKIKMLKKLKEDIVFMNNNGLIHGDLIPGNILFDKNGCKIIDFDNCSYNNSLINISQINNYSYEFIKYYGVNKNLDTFLFNLLTYSIINNCNFYTVRKSVYDKKFKYFGDNDDAIKICNSFYLQDLDPNCHYLIDTIDESKII